MKRGEIWTAAGAKDYAGKPSPVVVLQDDRFETELSITVCGLTSDMTEAPFVRMPVMPSVANGLHVQTVVMIDKISTLPRHKLGRRIGRLSEADMLRLNRAIIVFLGLAGAPALDRT